MIVVQNLSKSYGGIKAIQNLNFSIQKGEVVGFLGPNGAGKSTTMKIITGYMSPSDGQALVCGFDVFDNPIEVKKRIGYLPETPPIYGDMKVIDYLHFVAEIKLVPRTKIKSAVSDSISKMHLDSVAHRYCQNLSKGFKQRVGIAQALVSNPEVLVLDEPTVGLDPKQVSEIRDLIHSLKGHHTIILSTHILSEVQMTCERIIIINQGQIVVQDSMDNLMKVHSGNQKIKLKVRSEGDLVTQLLAKIEGVRAVKNIQTHTWEIECHEDEAMIERVAQTAMVSGLGLLEISGIKADLEDVYLKLTDRNEVTL